VCGLTLLAMTLRGDGCKLVNSCGCTHFKRLEVNEEEEEVSDLNVTLHLRHSRHGEECNVCGIHDTLAAAGKVGAPILYEKSLILKTISQGNLATLERIF